MKTNYSDIIDVAGEPKWYDPYGAPRYCEFDPYKCGVYIGAAALLHISCQGCEQEFTVAWEFENIYRLYNRPIDNTHIDYGDPPIHNCIGDTMSTYTVEILEYHELGKFITDGSFKDQAGQPIGGKVIGGDMNWHRIAELEGKVEPPEDIQTMDNE